MLEATLKILAVVGSLQRDSALRSVIEHISSKLEATCSVDVLDFKEEPLALYDPDTARELPDYRKLQSRVDQADVLLLATPDYHGSISSAMKNFLDHFWQEFAGKLFVTIVASPEKGLTVIDQLRTVARQCYAWTLPYGIGFTTGVDIKDGKVTNEAFRDRLEMVVRDLRIYGELLARQRRLDLIGNEPGFLAHYRKREH